MGTKTIIRVWIYLYLGSLVLSGGCHKSSTTSPNPEAEATEGSIEPPSSPLLQAVSKGLVDQAQKLVIAGADPNEANQQGETPLTISARRGDVSMVRMLLTHKALPHSRGKGTPPLHACAADSTLNVMKLLVAAGADVNEKSSMGRTAIHCCAEQGQVRALDFLVTHHGGYLAARDNEGRTPLHLAAKNGHLGAVHFILQHEPTVLANAKDTHGATPLHLAAGRQLNWPIIDALLAGGVADILAEDSDHQLPMDYCMRAAWMPHVLIGNKLMWLSVEERSRELIIFALYGGRLANTLLPCSQNYRAAAAAVIGYEEEAANIDSRDPYGDTPLHWAANLGKPETVKFLISQGANVNAPGKAEMTPLHLAACAGNLENARMLIMAGANVNSVDATQLTPLHCAADAGHAELVKLLLANGADPRLKNMFGETPAEDGNGYPDVVAIFRTQGGR